MPIYRYKCKTCTVEVELHQKMSDRKTPEDCEHCDSPDMFQVITAPTFVLKGRGWANYGYNYTKTPADELPGYSDKDKQVILPSKKKSVSPTAPVPAPIAVKSASPETDD